MSFLVPKPPPPIPVVNPADTANRANQVQGAALAAGGRQATFLSTLTANTAGRPAPTLTGLGG